MNVTADGDRPTTADATKLCKKLSEEIEAGPAAAWIHAPAVVRNAERAGLVPSLLDASGEPRLAIQAAVERLAGLHPTLAPFADPDVNPLWSAEPSPGLAAEIIELWRRRSAVPNEHRNDGHLLGDLYEHLSAEARKQRALVQTPRFVTKLLLELSYDNAFEEWGEETTLIDPACGTGHILVDAYIHAWARMPRRIDRSAEPIAVRALAAVAGVDIDPYAVAIARYRLLAVFCAWLGADLRRAPAELPLRLAVADSLLDDTEPLLQRGQYHVVVTNPPYITCKDPATRERIRTRYRDVCSGRYSLAVPFEQLMHELCVPGGWVARLTANSFMKREFGRKLIESYFPTIDLR